ncbi:anthranilate synthase component I family protein [Psychrobacter sp. DM8]|uniref:anthranilate synthase component I family protein n=1 Tax=Psychrobacter sp. DM8 TaxID=3440636 RepID=UPI003F4FA12C
MRLSKNPYPLTTPVIQSNSWRFGDLAAADLLPILQRHLLAQDQKARWQLIWLNNKDQPVIGLLPKVSWQVYPDSSYQNDIDNSATYQIIKHCRDTGSNSDKTSNDKTCTKIMTYHAWQNELITYSEDYKSDNNHSALTDAPKYHHGLMGFIGYDIAAHHLSPNSNIKQAHQPCAVLGHYDIYLSADKDQTQWTLQVKSDNSALPQDSKAALIKKLITYLDVLNSQLAMTNTFKSATKPLVLTAKWQKSDYQQAFIQTQNYLQQGDCYQINLTQAWLGGFDADAGFNDKSATQLLDYLPALHRSTQAPFAGYMSVTPSIQHSQIDRQKAHFELLSCSPELFFTFISDSKTSTHYIRTKPIKGTQPRGATAEQDKRLKQQLIDSAKDRSENVMIVDLLRNDLGKYAKIGSVKVPQLFDIESFSNVHHMVSTITAELRSETHPLSVLFGSLPAGSITGTPKKRAVEIIAELETVPRGAYCGTMGYMNFDGSGQWNVLIRTLQAQHNPKNNSDSQVSLWAGGGITVASDCSDEYQECLDKVGNLLAVLHQNKDKTAS